MEENQHSVIERIEKDLKACVSELAEMPEEDIDSDINIHEYGFDSFKFVRLASSLIDYYKIEISPSIFFGYSTIKELSRYYLEEYGDVLKDFYKEGDTIRLIKEEKCGSDSLIKSDEMSNDTGSFMRGDAGFKENQHSIIERIEKDLKAYVSVLAEIPEDDVDPDINIHDYGFDSFKFVQLASSLINHYDIEISPSIFFGYNTIKELTRFYLEEYEDDLIEFYRQDDAEGSIQGEDQGPESSNKSNEYAITLEVKNCINKVNDEPIAIIGMSGRFPMADDLDEFWQNLFEGRDCIQEIPKERWDWREYYGDPQKEENKTNIKWGGFISGADEFDPEFFNISPEDATIMDPQQRLMLTHVWKALEDAGYSARSLSGSQTGVFIGASPVEYISFMSRLNILNYSSGMISTMGPNRISYFFNLNGPSESIDTTCSSSLVAIHRAIDAMKNGSCEMAVAGGVNMILTPDVYLNSQADVFSKDGRCKTFSDDADGFVRGEGVGIIILKKLTEAEKAKDHIYGVIRSTAENHNGRSAFFSSLDSGAQAELLSSAYSKAGIDPRSIGYIETHGTGTKLGDPIEIDGLRTAFRELYKSTGDLDVTDAHCGLGSGKTNIGHLEVASGIAGVIKVLLQLKHKTLVKNLHSEKINSYIKLNDSPFYIVHENKRWKSLKDSRGNTLPRRAGVSSFGVGGTNAHVVIEEYISENEDQHVSFTSASPAIIIFSAGNEKRLKEQIQLFLEWIRNTKPSDDDLPKISYTLQVGRESMKERMALVVGSINELTDKLKKYLEDENTITGLFRGKDKKKQEILSEFTDDEDLERKVSEWLNNKNYTKLLSLWVGGLEIDWDRLYRSERPFRISLPTYPFARESYWIDALESSGEANKSKPVLTKNEDIADWFYEPVWEVSRLSSPLKNDEVYNLELCWLVFVDELGIGEGFIEKLKQRNRKVIAVKTGDSFIKLDDHTYSINPGVRKDYDSLIKILKSNDVAPSGIVHLWSVTKDEYKNEIDENSRIHELGFYSLIYLAQAIGESGLNEKFQIDVISNNIHAITGGEQLCPEKATLMGPVKVIPREYPDIRCRSIDVIVSETDGADDREIIVEQLLKEIISSSKDSIVAHRVNQRWVQTFNPVHLKKSIEAPRLKRRGVYLITGGLGGIGLSIAEYLAKTVQAKLILIGRSVFPDKKEWAQLLEQDNEDTGVIDKIRKLQQIEKAGAEIFIGRADVSDLDQMGKVIKDAEDKFGKISGIIHSAGIAGGGLIQLKKAEEAERVFKPKIKGTMTLEYLMRDRKLDFFVLCSSISSIIGGIGLVDYCAANAFLDVFAHYKNTTGNTLTKSVNWDGWQEVGMAVNTKKIEDRQGPWNNYLHDYGLSPDEGIDAFSRLLSSKSTQIIVSTTDFHVKYDQNSSPVLEVASEAEIKRPGYPRSEFEIEYVPPVNNIEKKIADIWQELLGIEKVGVEDNFFEVGGNSLLLIQLHGKLREIFSKEISIADLFKYPNIKLFASYISQGDRSSRAVSVSEHGIKRSGEYQPVAIIGMACRFPGSRNAEDFWQNIYNGVESISHFSDEDLLSSGVDPDLLTMSDYVKSGYLVEDIELFDAGFFNMSPREAEITDPQRRLFLECAYEALERSGYASDAGKNRIGLFAGQGDSRYLRNLTSNPYIISSTDEFKVALANSNSYLSTYVSYKLNLNGPSLNIQTACSTALVAVHYACQSILNGECDIALAGGVTFNSLSKSGYLYQKGNIYSPDGRCRAFDAKGQGMAFGSGLGIVVLKRLKDALADGDPIEAVIKGSAVNNDGSLRVGFTAPGEDGQTEVIREAQAAASIKAETISYIEAHGTGTILGDPIEIKALTRAFREDTDKKCFCAIGSVKTNIGHTDTAGGVAGLIKTAMALKHKKIPASLHFNEPNPEIDFENSPFYVNTDLCDWESNGVPRRAGVSSFGFGGTNAHVILEEAPTLPDMRNKADRVSRPYNLIALSAITSSALEIASANLLEHLEKHTDLDIPDVAYSLNVGRKSFSNRRVIICSDREEALDLLGKTDSKRVITGLRESERQNITFMFSGQGAQYTNMGVGLYRDERAFRDHIDYCAEFLAPQLGLDPRDIIFPSDDDSDHAAEQLKQTSITQPALFVIEYALARLLLSWGIRPTAMIGHSIGEYVAACLSGVFSLEDCLSLVALRGRLIHSLPKGSMLAVPLSEKKLKPLLGESLSIATVNSPDQCAVSGTPEDIKLFKNMMEDQGVTCVDLRTSHAFHSKMMEPVLKEYADQVKKIELNPPLIPFISNVTGTWITEQEAVDPDYWSRHMRQTVRFADGIKELIMTGNQVMLEIGPGRTLKTLAMQHPDIKSDNIVLNSIRHPRETTSDMLFLLTTLGRLWVEGVKIDWPEFYRHEEHRRIVLPTYPFEKQRYWVDAKPISIELNKPKDDFIKKKDISEWFYEPVWEVSKLRPLSKQGETDDPELTWLVFVDESGIGDGLIEGLKQKNQKIIKVKAADYYVKEDDCTFNINPAARDDYDSLIDALKTNDITPSRIVHLWSVYEGSDHITYDIEFHKSQILGSYSIIYLTQAINEAGFTENITINVISNNMQEVTGIEKLYPEKATLMGPITVIPQENTNIQCRSIDIDLAEIKDDSRQKIIENLLLELENDSSDSTIAYRGEVRSIRAIKPVHLEKTTEGYQVKENSVYLITGGLGNIGLKLAEHLAKTIQVRLVLTGRSSFPEKVEWDNWLSTHKADDNISRKIQRLKRIERLGSEIMVASIDVAKMPEMERLVLSVEERFGGIHGVFHAAGIIENKAFKTVKDVKRKDFEHHFLPKVKGTINLEKVFMDRETDFCILFSSLSSILGGIGYTAYSTANLFMDSFVRKYNRATIHPWISINFDAWTLDPEKIEDHPNATRKIEELAMIPEEGLKAINYIMQSNMLDQVIVSTGDLQQRYCRWVKLEYKQKVDKASDRKVKRAKYSRPEALTPFVEPVSETEKILVDIWEELLGIEKIGVNDDFFELGGDSLLATQVISRLREIFSVELSLSSMYELPEVGMIASHIDTINQIALDSAILGEFSGDEVEAEEI